MRLVQSRTGLALSDAIFVAAEEDRSDLQQIGQKASDAFNKAAGSVKEAFEVIDDNVLEYCSLDAKVPILSLTAYSVQYLLLIIVKMTVRHHRCNILHAGWQAHVQDEPRRKGIRISGSFEGNTALFNTFRSCLLLFMQP